MLAVSRNQEDVSTKLRESFEPKVIATGASCEPVAFVVDFVIVGEVR
jgi:hypothetical protein